MTWRIDAGDARAVLAGWPAGSVQCVVTSPPYYLLYSVQYGGIITGKGGAKMPVSTCKWCGKEVQRKGKKPAVFCSIECKAAWQRTQKPVDREWLYQKYVVEGLSTYAIGKLVGRDPKGVFKWLRGYDIPTRERTWETVLTDAPYQQEEWLRREYLDNKRSTGEIAAQFNVTDGAIKFHLDRLGIPRRTMSETRAIKHWGQSGEANPMYGKRGAEVPNWKGGCTPERQAFYSSLEWAAAVKVVWRRDKATCQRCGTTTKGNRLFHIHHIVSFAVRELRADPDNLLLLCDTCHRWVHSRKNTAREFIREWKGVTE